MGLRRREADRQVALLTIAQLASTSPRMIPLEGGFDGSADRLLEDPLPVADVIAGFSRGERERLVSTYRELFGRSLARLAPQCRGEADVDEAILLGVLIAGVNDRHLGVLADAPERLDLL